MEFISWARSDSTKFSKTLLAPSVVSLTAARYDNEGTAPTPDVQQIHPSKSYLRWVLFSLSQSKPFMILFHKDLKLSYKLGGSCNMHCSRQMLVYLYFGKLFRTRTLNILQMCKCTLELVCGEVKSSHNPPQHQHGDSSLRTVCSQPCQTRLWSHSHFAFHQAKPSPEKTCQNAIDFEGENA